MISEVSNGLAVALTNSDEWGHIKWPTPFPFIPSPILMFFPPLIKGRRCRDRMVVGFTTTYGISTYHH